MDGNADHTMKFTVTLTEPLEWGNAPLTPAQTMTIALNSVSRLTAAQLTAPSGVIMSPLDDDLVFATWTTE